MVRGKELVLGEGRGFSSYREVSEEFSELLGR